MNPSHRPKLWTKAGLSELGRLIRFNRESQKMTLVETAILIKERTGENIGFRTLSTIEVSTGEPRYNTLAVIAAAGFVKKDGVILDIFDFIEIASESPLSPQRKSGISMSILSQLINNYLNSNNITLKQFALLCGIEPEDLEAIALGFETPDYEGDLILLSRYLQNPETGREFNNHPEMVQYCEIKNRCNSETHLTQNGVG